MSVTDHQSNEELASHEVMRSTNHRGKFMLFFVVPMFSIGLFMLGANVTYGETYPNRPIRILASEPGAQVDLAARLIAQGLAATLKQPVIVHNRPGILSIETASREAPDGYSLLMYTSAVWVLPMLQKTAFDIRDFAPVTVATNAPLFLFAHPSMPAKSIKELIALAKARPGELNYGSAGAGGTNHLAFELFKSMAGIDIVRIPYKGSGAAVVGLVANQVQLMFVSAPVGMSHVKAGRLRVLGAATAKPSALAADVPTIAASGLPGYEAASVGCIWAPAKTPRTIIVRLNKEIVSVLGQPDVKEKMLLAGIEAVGTTLEQTAAYIKSDMAKLEKVIKDAGIRQD